MTFHGDFETWLTRLMTPYFDHAASEDWRGRPFVPPPWDNLSEYQRAELPLGSQLKPVPTKALVAYGLIFVVVGLLFGAAFLAFGAGLLAVIWYSARDVGKAAGAWELSAAPLLPQAETEVPFQVTLNLNNTDVNTRGPYMVRLVFTGSGQNEHYVAVPKLSAHEVRRVVFTLNPDVGMGKFRLGGIVVAVRDRLGLYTRCSEFPFEMAIEVVPRSVPATAMELDVASVTNAAGAVALRRAGGSEIFLGLRPWQAGDSIRHIDWRRSERHGDLLVKEFEWNGNPEASLIFDQSVLGHCGFKEISTLESLRRALLSVALQLLNDRCSVRLMSSTEQLPSGTGNRQRDALMHVAKNLRVRQGADFMALLAQAAPQLPVDSLAVLFFCTGNVDAARLWESLLHFADRRIETVLIAADTSAFAATVKQAAGLQDVGIDAMAFLQEAAAHDPRRPDALGRLASTLSKRTFVLGPGQSLAEVAGA